MSRNNMDTFNYPHWETCEGCETDFILRPAPNMIIFSRLLCNDCKGEEFRASLNDNDKSVTETVEKTNE